jgi:hypothetical protein
VSIHYYLALYRVLLMTHHLFVFGSRRASSQSSAGTQVPVLPALEQASTNIFLAPMPPPRSSSWLGNIGMKRRSAK